VKRKAPVYVIGGLALLAIGYYLLIVSSILWNAFFSWQNTPGALIPAGTAGLAVPLGDERMRWTRGEAVFGHERLADRSMGPERPFYFFMAVPPRRNYFMQGGGFSNQGPASIQDESWMFHNPDGKGDGEGRLAVRFDALKHTVAIGEQTFKLAEGNLFFICLDEQWRPHAEQLSDKADDKAAAEWVLGGKITGDELARLGC
jgi:hypothetical protein